MSNESAEIRTRLDDVRARASAAAERSGRDADSVRILLATKTQPVPAIVAALEHGFTLIGENRVQELVAKGDELRPYSPETHLIGPLQSNKINHTLRYASCIQSLDRMDTAEKLQRRLEVLDTTVEVFVQVNVSREESKSGIDPAETLEFAHGLTAFDRLRPRGLMTIGLPAGDPDLIRPGYRELVAVRDRLRQEGIEGIDELSMGMSADFELAIEEGATMVRIGSTVFGSRPTSPSGL